MSAQVLSSEAPAPEIDDAAEGTLMAHMACLLDDAPKLQVALKNLMAVLLGSDASRRSADDAVDGKVTDIKAFDLLVCSKTLVKVLSDVSLAEAPQWGAENPQGDNQSFSDRITEISQYKAALVFFKRAKASGAGISKSVGRKFIQQTKCMTQLRTGVKISLCSKIEEDIIDLFLDTFESSIAGLSCLVSVYKANRNA